MKTPLYTAAYAGPLCAGRAVRRAGGPRSRAALWGTAGLWTWTDRGDDGLGRPPPLIYLRPNFIASTSQIILALQLLFLTLLQPLSYIDGTPIEDNPVLYEIYFKHNHHFK